MRHSGSSALRDCLFQISTFSYLRKRGVQSADVQDKGLASVGDAPFVSRRPELGYGPFRSPSVALDLIPVATYSPQPFDYKIEVRVLEPLVLRCLRNILNQF